MQTHEQPAITAHTSAARQPFWLLNTASSSYALGIDTSGYLQHMYWGARLARASDYGEPAPFTIGGGHERSEGVSNEEYPTWGDLKFGDVCLKLRFTDGTRTALFSFEATDITPSSLTLTLVDEQYGLRLDLIYKVYVAENIIERKARLTNGGEQPVMIDRIYAATWRFPGNCPYTLSYFSGKWGADFQLEQSDASTGKQVLESRRGITGFEANPFFMIHDPGASEQHGDVYAGALAYSGNWQFVLEKNPHGQVSLSGGVSDFDFTWQLAPGENFETPAFAGCYARGLAAASQQLHSFQLEHTLPEPHAKTVRPVLYNSWYATGFGVSAENQLAAARVAKELGAELFVMDDGWFGERNNDEAGLGDWYVNREKFPNGLDELINGVKDLGLDFGIWVEPEMVNPDSDLYRAHPDWVYQFATRPRSLGRNQLVLNLAREDVKDYLLNVLDTLLKSHDITFLKWDMNRSFSEPGWAGAPAGRDQELWVRHTRAVYEIMGEGGCVRVTRG